MRRGTQADHYRGVATMAIGMADGSEAVMGDIGIDRDLLIAAALVPMSARPGVRPVGALEDRTGAHRQPRAAPPGVRRPSGALVGLPSRWCTAWPRIRILAEGAFVKASLETTIVQYADVAFWKVLEAGGRSRRRCTSPVLRVGHSAPALTGKRALVTGAARGIGFAIAAGLDAAGAGSSGWTWRRRRGRAFASLPSQARFRRLDVTGEHAWEP